LFSNITDISGFRGTKSSTLASTFKFRRSARIRRNSGLKIFNSILMDAPFGVMIDGSAVRANLQSGVAKFKNNLIAGTLYALDTTAYSNGTSSVYAALRDSIFGSGTGLFKNDSASTTANILVTPYNFTAPDYRPNTSGLGVLNAAFTDAAFNGLLAPCDEVNAPGTMTGFSNIYNCLLYGQVYSIPAIANASNYFWTVPAGVTITAGQGTRSITVTFASTFVSGTITVVGKNDCGNSSVAATKTIVTTVLGTPGTITAPTGFTTNVCTVVGVDTSLTYSITAVAGATDYVWANPTNTIITSGQGTNSIKLKFLAGFAFLVGDSLKVNVTSGCKTSVTKTLAIKTALPAVPTSITATAVASNVCGARIYRYAAPALVAGATGYQWQLPTGSALATSGSLDSGSLSGATARYIRVIYTSNAIAGANDSIRVRYTANCGVTAYKGLKLAITALNAPAAPTAITITSLGAINCGQPRYRYAAPAVLPIATTTAGAATGWEWSFTGTLGATFVADSGSTSTRVVTGYFTSTAAATVAIGSGDSVKCRYTSGCGFGAYKVSKLTNTLTSSNPPATPSTLTVTLVSDVCGARVYRYAAPVLPAGTATNAAPTGYEWSLPTGSAVATSGTLDSGVLSGRYIRVIYTSNAGAVTTDSIRVRYTSACGVGNNKAAKLTNVAKVCFAGAPVYSKTTNTTDGIKAQVYPNPNAGIFTVRIETGVTSRATASIQIFDMNGRVVSNFTAQNNNGLISENINNSNLNNGIYTVRYTVGNVTNTIKMVVQK